MSRRGKGQVQPGDQVAGNGILNRRMFLDGALIAGAAGDDGVIVISLCSIRASVAIHGFL